MVEWNETHLLAFGIGIVGWTLAEYSIHRWVFHGTSKWESALLHRQHHRDVGYFATWAQKGIAAAQVLPILVGIAWVFLDLTLSLSFGAGFVAMYLVYQQFHQDTHEIAPKTAYGRWCRKQHFTHHFHTPHLNHGVTCPWWDMVFQTYGPVEQVRVPRRQAMDWLIDPATGEVFEDYQSDYALKGAIKMKKAA